LGRRDRRRHADDFIVGTSVADIIDSKEDNDVNHGDIILDDGSGDEVILGGEESDFNFE
jgi:hypothetical protein